MVNLYLFDESLQLFFNESQVALELVGLLVNAGLDAVQGSWVREGSRREVIEVDVDIAKVLDLACLEEIEIKAEADDFISCLWHDSRAEVLGRLCVRDLWTLATQIGLAQPDWREAQARVLWRAALGVYTPAAEGIAGQGLPGQTGGARLEFVAALQVYLVEEAVKGGVQGALTNSVRVAWASRQLQRWVIAIWEKKSITNYITNYFCTK